MKLKRQMKTNLLTNEKPMYNDEKGIILVVALAMLAVLELVAAIAFNTTNMDIKISNNYKNGIQAFYIAEAGAEHAKTVLADTTLNNVLDGTFGGSPGVLDFGSSAPFGSGTYDVLVTDDEGSVDTDNSVIITSAGILPNGSKSVVEITILKTAFTIPPIPGAITLVGEADTTIVGNAVNVDGRDWMISDDDISGPTGTDEFKYAIALSNIGEGESSQTPNDAVASLDSDITGQQEDNFAGTSTTYTESIGLDTSFTSEALQEFVDEVKQVADNTLMVSDIPPSGITGSTSGTNNQITIGSQSIELGSVANQKITYFNMKPEDNGGSDQQVEFKGNITGAGILIIEGNDLIFRGNLDWTGIVIVIGDEVGGGLLGGGNKDIRGAFIVDEQDTDPISWNELVLTGNVDVRYSLEAVTLAQEAVLNKGFGMVSILSWRQL